MTDKELKELQDKLWGAADILRSGAHLAANKFGQPILGLIFLRYADILYKQHKEEIEKEYNSLKGTRREKNIEDIAIEKCGFYLPEEASYTKINDAPDTAEKAILVKKAMDSIEKYNKQMEGVLPKEVYGQLVPEEEPDLLSRIMRIFMDIPEDIGIDLFGQIYEYFLGNFALEEGKGGGAFYTPASVVRYMVEVLKPEYGNKKFLDPACGSGGMFVQAARYMHKHNKNAANDDVMQFVCNGVEKEPDTVKLAKMNLLLNNVRGEIKEANSFYSDPYNAYGNYDYVMANPPFNVDEVVYERIKDDKRFNKYGLPKNKSKSGKKDDKKETVPNANYLWISYFATALNNNGKAALVMANSASDAGNSEYEIRKSMIEEGIIKQMVTLPSNMFSTVTLPATLWFFDKQKCTSPKKDEILFIDARNVFTQVDRAHRKFSDEQIKNLGIITRLYEGDTQAFTDLIAEYQKKVTDAKENHDFEYAEENRSFNAFFPDFEKQMKGKKNGEKELAASKERHQMILDNIETEYKETTEYFTAQINWLKERFPEGKYQDVIGLCKVAKLEGEDGIIDQDYSLNPGRYVGVVIEDDGMTEEEFKETMLNLNDELSKLNEEARALESEIESNLKELFR